MAEKKSGKRGSTTGTEKISDADVEQIYADAPLELGVGPFVSRVIFGVQKASESSYEPTIQLVMPSNALLSFAQMIVQTFGKDSIAKQVSTAHAKFAIEMKDPVATEVEVES